MKINKNEIKDFLFMGMQDYKTSKKDKMLVALLVLVLLLGFITIK